MVSIPIPELLCQIDEAQFRPPKRQRFDWLFRLRLWLRLDKGGIDW